MLRRVSSDMIREAHVIQAKHNNNICVCGFLSFERLARPRLHRRDTQALEAADTAACDHRLRLVLRLCGRGLRELESLAGSEDGRALLLEVGVEHSHLLARLLPVLGVPVRVRALLSAGDLRGRRRAGLLCDPQAHLFVVSPVPIPTANIVSLRKAGGRYSGDVQLLSSDLLQCVSRRRVEHEEQCLVAECCCLGWTWRWWCYIVARRKVEVGFYCMRSGRVCPRGYERRVQASNHLSANAARKRSRCITHPGACMSSPIVPKSVPTESKLVSRSALLIMARRPRRPHLSAGDMSTCCAGVCGTAVAETCAELWDG